MAVQPYAERSLLAHFLALLYGLAIVFASLQPFSPWVAPLAGTPFFLFGPWPQYWTRFDVIANFIAYAPLGLLLGLLPRQASASNRLTLAVIGGGAMSFAMETAQMFMPPRVASVLDLLSNTGGAAGGGAVAILLSRSPWASRVLSSFRDHWFLPGKVGDMGLALLAIWLVVQVNPSIPLFAVTFDPGYRVGPSAVSDATLAAPDLAAILVESAHSALQMLGVGLFLALLLRQRRYVGGGVLVLVCVASLIKGVAAAVLLKPAVWQHWLTPGVSTGVAAGTLLLLAAIGLPRPAQVAIATIALLSSLFITLLAPEILFAHAPLSAFNWSYGHLLNFNGLTHTVLLAWPVVATLFLFTMVGRPRWGEPGF